VLYLQGDVAHILTDMVQSPGVENPGFFVRAIAFNDYRHILPCACRSLSAFGLQIAAIFDRLDNLDDMRAPSPLSLTVSHLHPAPFPVPFLLRHYFVLLNDEIFLAMYSQSYFITLQQRT